MSSIRLSSHRLLFRSHLSILQVVEVTENCKPGFLSWNFFVMSTVLGHLKHGRQKIMCDRSVILNCTILAKCVLSNSKLSYFIMQFSMFKQHRYVIWDKVTFRVQTLIIIIALENWLAKIMYRYYAIWWRIWALDFETPSLCTFLQHWKSQIITSRYIVF